MKRFRLLSFLLIMTVLLAFPAHASAQVPDPEAWVDDLSQQIDFTVDGLWYNLLLLHATVQWFLMKVCMMLGIVIDLVTQFMAEQAFAPLIRSSNGQWGMAVSMSFTIAMLVLGMSYMVAHFIRLNVVELRSALLWYAVVGLFFQLGPELYQSMNSLRSDINAFFYATSLEAIHQQGSPLSPLQQHLSPDTVPMFQPCDNFGWLSGHSPGHVGQGVDGLDIAMAYLRATSRDVLGQPPAGTDNCLEVNPGGYETNLPFDWYFTDGYFDVTVSPPTWEFIPADDKIRSLDMAAAGQYRLIGAWPLLWLGLFEKLVYLLVTFAQGLSFISFSVAAIFAFFKRTEAIARSVVDLWIEIIITTVVISLGQALIVSLALAAAATQNPLASIGVGLLCAILMLILLFSATKLVWNAATHIFGTISQATGGAIMTPGQVMAGATVGAVGAAAAVATGGGALALAGAAMTGMSASGLGGQGMSMAGGQLMLAGRMRRTTPPASIPSSETAQLETVTGVPDKPVSMQTRSLPARMIPAFDPGDLLPDSPLGRRTAGLEGQFTLMETALQTDNQRDEQAAQAMLAADNTRDDAALRDNLKLQSTSSDTTGLDRAARELSSAASALKTTAHQHQQERLMGRLDVMGKRETGAVVADAVDLERDYRRRMNKPLLEGAGDSFGGRMAQAVGLQPQGTASPVSEPARFQAVGDQALRLGLRGDQVMQVLEAQTGSNDPSIPDDLYEQLVTHVQRATGANQRVARHRVGQLLTFTAAMSEAVQIRGTLAARRWPEEYPDDE